MTVEQQTHATRTVSADGTEIGYWSSGEGPPLLLVHGGLGDHTRWDALRPLLEPHATVHAVDRRGRGASGDAADYDLSREYEDVAAVVDSIADASGSPVDVYCSSYGGICTVGAAALTSNIRSLALYEAWPLEDPSLLAPPPEFVSHLEELLEEGQREQALEAAYRDVLKLSPEELDTLRAQPSWSSRIAAVHTIPREFRAFAEARFDPEQVAGITVPTLLLTGSESPDIYGPDAVAAAMPDARIAVLEGQAHVADLLAPELVAETLLAFLRERP